MHRRFFYVLCSNEFIAAKTSSVFAFGKATFPKGEGFDSLRFARF